MHLHTKFYGLLMAALWLPTLALADTTITGQKKGAFFQITVPTVWNGDLVINNHGFDFNPPAANPGLGSLAPLQLAEGYAVAASSYANCCWTLFSTKKDINRLLEIFDGQLRRAERRDRPRRQPRRHRHRPGRSRSSTSSRWAPTRSAARSRAAAPGTAPSTCASSTTRSAPAWRAARCRAARRACRRRASRRGSRPGGDRHGREHLHGRAHADRVPHTGPAGAAQPAQVRDDAPGELHRHRHGLRDQRPLEPDLRSGQARRRSGRRQRRRHLQRRGHQRVDPARRLRQEGAQGSREELHAEGRGGTPPRSSRSTRTATAS